MIKCKMKNTMWNFSKQIDNNSIEMARQFVERSNIAQQLFIGSLQKKKEKSQRNTLNMVAHNKCFDTVLFHFSSLFEFFFLFCF